MTDPRADTAAPDNSPPPARSSSSPWTTLSLGIGLVGEVVLAMAATRGWLSMPAVFAGHLAIVAALVTALRTVIIVGTDDGTALVGVLATLATGPFGAAGVLLLPLFTRRSAHAEARLPAWYRRIALAAEQDQLTQLSDQVAIGRAANLVAQPPGAFDELFRSGPIARQQAALGMIARAFHPDYLPVLKIALTSPEPVIRVQAAAVAARIRSQLQARVVHLIGRAADPTLTPASAVSVSAELAAAAASGLLEDTERDQARRIREALMSRTFAALDARARRDDPRGSPRPPRIDDATAAAYAAHLLAQGRFDEFRTARLAHRRTAGGRYRMRLVRARPRPHDLRLAPLAVRR